jgi:hypothetical protein
VNLEVRQFLRREEELSPELEAYFERFEGLPTIRHPLVYSILHDSKLNAFVNAQLAFKKDAVAKAFTRRMWSRYILLHEKPHRLDAFRRIEGFLTDTEYWSLLGECWTGSENLFQEVNLKSLLSADRPSRSGIMHADEQAFLNGLPPRIRIYRGHGTRNAKGLSWTLSPGRATWFANREGPSGKVRCGYCSRTNVIAVFLRRAEMEVVILPENVQQYEPPQRETELVRIWHAAMDKFDLGVQTDHGTLHWDAVEANALALAKADPGINVKVARTFALVHDCCRQDEDDAPNHGPEAAKWIGRNLSLFRSYLSQLEVDVLQTAVRAHTGAKTTNDPTIGACFDADRLDLPRVGIKIDPRRLSTEVARQQLLCA